jgi:hypothetical protein
VTLEVEAGFEGWIAAGQAFPVTVTVTAEHLVHGTLQVEVGGATGTVELAREVEVTAGNSTSYRFLAPGSVIESSRFVPDDERVVAARLRDGDGDVVARADATTRTDMAQEVVGVLPLAADGAGPLADAVPLPVDAGVARLTEVAPGVLDLGPLALSPLDQLVATPSELAALPDDQRAAVLGWVDAGGHLVLPGDEAELDAAVEVLPDGWAPAQGDGARAGLGQVRSVPAGWTDRLLPTPARSGLEEDVLAQDTIGSGNSLRGSLSGDAGVRLPPSTRLAVLLALYVLVAGPVAFLLVRRLGRRPLAFAIVPVLALTSTGAVVGAGGSLRRTAASAHVTVYEVGPGGATATTWALLSNPRRQGDVGIEMPDGWTVTDAMSVDGGWDGIGGGSVAVRDAGEGIAATTRPPAGGFGFLQAEGPVSGLGDGLVVTATSGDDELVEGTVRNDLDVTLDEVAVMVGRNAIAEIGQLGPGEEASFTVEAATVWQGRPAPETAVWPDDVGTGVRPDGGGFGMVVEGVPGGGGLIIENEVGDGGVIVERRRGDNPATGAAPGFPAPQPGPGEPPPPPRLPPGEPVFPRPGAEDGDQGSDDASDEPVVMAAWSALMGHAGWNYRPLGQAVAVGWTEDLVPPVATTGSGDVARSRSAVVGRATVVPSGDRVTDAAVVASMVRGPLTQAADPGALPAVVAFDLPAGVDGRPVDPGRLAVHVPGSPFSTDVWTPDGWVPLPDVPPGESDEVDLPAGAVVGGQVFVRWQHPPEPLQAGRELIVYEKESA